MTTRPNRRQVRAAERAAQHADRAVVRRSAAGQRSHSERNWAAEGVDTENEPLPFALTEALSDPDRCRAMLHGHMMAWERRVVTPLLEVGCRQSASLSYFERYGTELSSSTDILEASLAETYDAGVDIARIHQKIYQVVSRENGWMIEDVWNRPRYQAIFHQVITSLALEIAARRNGLFDLESRLSCPELSIEGLCSDGQTGFIPLLRRIVESATTFPDATDYLPIISSDFDRDIGIDRAGNASIENPIPLPWAVRVKQARMEHNRNHFLAWVMYAILLQLQGEIPHLDGQRKSTAVELPSLVVKPRIGGDYIRPRPAKSALFDTSVGTAILDAATTRGERLRGQRMLEAERSVQELLKPYCTACERTADEIREYVRAGRKQLNQCSACHALDPPRRVYYCSKSCAQIDWKAGHKLICGKLHSTLRLPFAGRHPVPSSPPPSVSRQIVAHQKLRSITDQLAHLDITASDIATSPPPGSGRMSLVDAEQLFDEGGWSTLVPDLVEHYMNVLSAQAIDNIVSLEQFRLLIEEGTGLFAQREKIPLPIDMNGAGCGIKVREERTIKDRPVQAVL